jgi:hypothetical protein
MLRLNIPKVLRYYEMIAIGGKSGAVTVAR